MIAGRRPVLDNPAGAGDDSAGMHVFFQCSRLFGKLQGQGSWLANEEGNHVRSLTPEEPACLVSRFLCYCSVFSVQCSVFTVIASALHVMVCQ